MNDKKPANNNARFFGEKSTTYRVLQETLSTAQGRYAFCYSGAPDFIAEIQATAKSLRINIEDELPFLIDGRVCALAAKDALDLEFNFFDSVEEALPLGSREQIYAVQANDIAVRSMTVVSDIEVIKYLVISKPIFGFWALCGFCGCTDANEENKNA